MIQNAIPVLILVGMKAEASVLLCNLGFTWDEDGLDLMDRSITAHKASLPTIDAKCVSSVYRLLLIVTSAEGTIDEAEANAWIPSPSALAEMEKRDVWVQRWGAVDVCSFGARAFLRLRRDDDAYELARLALRPDQGSLKKTTLVSCHSILGQVAARRGDTDEAEGHFARALVEAKASRLPMLEILAARDWKEHLISPYGRDYSEAEMVIDAACAKMKKSRDQLGRVLGTPGP